MAFPSVPVLDTFVRTAETPLSDGGLWATSSGILGVAAGKTNGTQALSNAALGTNSGSGWNSSFATPVEIFVDIPTTMGSANVVRLELLSSPTSATASGYFAQIASSGAWSIRREDAGAGGSTLVSGSSSWPSGCSVGFSLSATGVLTMWRKASGVWVSLGQVGDTTYTGSFFPGWLTADTTVRFANFGAGVSVTSIVPPWGGPRRPAVLPARRGRSWASPLDASVPPPCRPQRRLAPLPARRGRPATPGSHDPLIPQQRRPRPRTIRPARGKRTITFTAPTVIAPAWPVTRVGARRRALVPTRGRRWTPFPAQAPAPLAPCITPPTSVRILPYASTGVITDYESAATITTYASTSTLVAYLASAIPKPYTAKAGIVAYTGKAAVVKYSSATTFGPTYCP